ncbi:hypothetical protein AN958_08226 [Leucoagaricus sp. SymC.cos]|nr:hypothetical protein AN958_08226 [Leucoagaricus sp. SymC.cos]
MGNSASRAARKLPKRAEPPAWVGKRTPGPTDPPAGLRREQVREKLASEQRTEAIEKDARDPHFLANLQQLGPVKVDHHMRTIRPEAAASNTAQLFKARQQHEHDLEAAQQHRGPVMTNTRFNAMQLTSALNARKGAANSEAMRTKARDLEVDSAKLESVARFINTPSVAKEGVRMFVDKDGNERTIAKVRR